VAVAVAAGAPAQQHRWSCRRLPDGEQHEQQEDGVAGGEQQQQQQHTTLDHIVEGGLKRGGRE